MENEFCIKGIRRIIVDETEFETINGIKIFLKNDKIYLKIYNEVSDKYTFGKLLSNIKELLSNKKEHHVKIDVELLHMSSERTVENIDVKCIVPEGDLLEINQVEVTDLGFLFEIIDIPSNEFIQQFELITKMTQAREKYRDKHGY